MKKYLKGLALVMLICVFAVCAVFGASAAKYQRDVVACDFESTSGAFLAPGDYDGNGVIEDIDHTALKALILDVDEQNAYNTVYAADKDTIYSDANGDGVIDIRDLVLQDENKGNDLVNEGALVLNGKSAYSDKVLAVMGTGAEYEIKYTYITETSLKAELNGVELLADKTETSTDEVTGAITVTRSIKTPFSLDNGKGIELLLVGEGKVEDISVTRVNMDNELADKETW